MYGIDFGTSTSLASESRDLGSRIVPLGSTTPWLPSVLGRDLSTWTVGESALRLAEHQILRSVKRGITDGRQSVPVHNGREWIQIEVDDAIRRFLAHLAERAADQFVTISDALSVRLGCPAMWDGRQRARLANIASDAGFGVGSGTLVDEPIAAGVAWIMSERERGRSVVGKLLIVDIGGGTLDTAVLDVEAPANSRVAPAISVQAADGDQNAGDCYDMAIAKDLALELESRFGVAVGLADARDDDAGWLLRAARQVKLDLTAREFGIAQVELSTGRYPIEYSRDRMAEAVAPLLHAMLRRIWTTLRAALMTQVAGSHDQRSMRPSDARRLEPSELAAGVDYVLLAGGMAQSPVVVDALGEWFPTDRIYSGAHGASPTELVALGLADADVFERMNLHRPGFDFSIEWLSAEGSESIPVYGAYTPLYDQQQVWIRDTTKHLWSASGRLPSRGSGYLVVRSMTGDLIRFRLDGEVSDALRFEFGSSAAIVSIEPNGRLFYRDGSGHERTFRIAQWPVIRGTGNEVVRLERAEGEAGMLSSLVWHQLPYD